GRARGGRRAGGVREGGGGGEGWESWRGASAPAAGGGGRVGGRVSLRRRRGGDGKGRAGSEAESLGRPRCAEGRRPVLPCVVAGPFCDRLDPMGTSAATNRNVLAIDQGTTGSTALVLSADGRTLGRATREFPQHFPRPGWVEHDPEELWTSVLEAIDGALRDSA